MGENVVNLGVGCLGMLGGLMVLFFPSLKIQDQSG